MTHDTGPRMDEFVKKLVPDPKNPPSTMLLSGFLGESSEEGHLRLYFDPALSSYVEIPSDAILHTEPLVAGQSGLGGSHVWVRQDAALIQSKAAGQDASARFFQGPIMQEFAGNQGMQQPAAAAERWTAASLTCPSVVVNCPSQTVICSGNCPSQTVICNSIACPTVAGCPTIGGCPTLGGCPSIAGCPSLFCQPGGDPRLQAAQGLGQLAQEGVAVEGLNQPSQICGGQGNYPSPSVLNCKSVQIICPSVFNCKSQTYACQVQRSIAAPCPSITTICPSFNTLCVSKQLPCPSDIPILCP